MGFWRDQVKRLRVKLIYDDIVGRQREVHEAQIDVAPPDFFRLFGTRERMQIQFDIRISFPKPPKQSRKRAELHSLAESDLQSPRLALSGEGSRLHCQVHPMHYPSGMFNERGPRRGKAHGVSGPKKEAHPHFRFERTNLLGEGGLREVEAFRGAAKMQVLG
jgi:hypothetical protein